MPTRYNTTDSNAAIVQADSFLTLHYSLCDDAGNEHVSTFGLSPATLQLGSGQLAAPLERCLIGLKLGQHHKFNLEGGTAFGPHNPQLIERIARNAQPQGIVLKENSLVEFSSSDGSEKIASFLRELTPDTALFDFNHPLAGKAIRFEGEIIGIL